MPTDLPPPPSRAPSLRLLTFVQAFGELLDRAPGEPALIDAGTGLLRELVAQDDWLAPAYTVADAGGYRQYLLHLDPRERFSVVAFVWGPGQSTPIHDHTTWGLIGMLRGAEASQAYRFVGPGRLVEAGPPTRLEPGQVEAVSPRLGDIHRVRNLHDDRTSISVHVYGGDIGTIQRGVYLDDGSRRPFVSGYSTLPEPA